jgi:5-methylcytosine-specific restriction protein B
MEETYPSTPAFIGRQVSELLRFAQRAEPRDVVLVMLGGRVLGVAEIAGPYVYKLGVECPHQRPVRWLSLGEWQSPNPEGLRTTFVALRRHSENLVEAERRVLDGNSGMGGARRAPQPLEGVQVHIQAALERKRQVILYGPPGTGKTYWAMRTARELAARDRFKSTLQELTPEQRRALAESNSVQTCCFHPAYGYEDFIEGYRPVARHDGRIGYELRSGIFKGMCERARVEEQRSFFLVVDEINRGDIPRIFGELLVALEKDKRGQPVKLPVSGEDLVVPDNLYVIGTMNTADRSIALLDAALRRRFAFIELMPDTSLLKGATVGGIPLGPWLDELNRRIAKHVGRDARHLQVGHSYLLEGGAPVTQLARFAEVLRYDIIPLLSEYCYEDFQTLSTLLGPGLVDVKQQKIDQSLFEPARLEILCERLLEGFPEITATMEAAEVEGKGNGPTGPGEADDDEDDEVRTGG